jgi:hypothetical protein
MLNIRHGTTPAAPKPKVAPQYVVQKEPEPEPEKRSLFGSLKSIIKKDQ